MKKVSYAGEGKSGGDTHSGKPKQIITHITSAHAKPPIFEKDIHPKAMNKPANCGSC